jgi:hypothetical protein
VKHSIKRLVSEVNNGVKQLKTSEESIKKIKQ